MDIWISSTACRGDSEMYPKADIQFQMVVYMATHCYTYNADIVGRTTEPVFSKTFLRKF